MLFARDIVGRNPGADIIFDVKCSRHLNALISEYGGRPIMWKTGHSHMKAKLKETGALLAGEFSGHICFGERWYGFDDALYSAARLLEIVGAESKSVSKLFAEFPVTFSTPEIKVNTTDSMKFTVMDRLVQGRQIRRRDDHGNRWHSRRLSRRLGIGAPVQHESGSDASFRSGRTVGARSDPARIP